MSALKKLLIITGTIALCGIYLTSEAALHDRGRGLIYDDVLDITWMQDANLFGTLDLDVVTSSYWYSDDWLSALNDAIYLGYSDWRAASMVPDNASYTTPYWCNSSSEEECKDNELGYMFYYNLSGTYRQNISGDVGPFKNIQNQYVSDDERSTWVRRWNFCFSIPCIGYGEHYGGGGNDFADWDWSPQEIWVVRDGDVPAVVPEPISSILFVTGGTLLAGRRYVKRKSERTGT